MRRSEHPEYVEIQPADPVARRRALWLAGAGVAFALALALSLSAHRQEFNRWAAEAGAYLVSRPEALFLAAFLFMLPMVAIAVYLYRVASRVLEAQRIPLPGQKVIKDTPVITGARAVRQGRAMQVVAVVLAVIGAALPFTLAWLVMTLMKDI